MCRSRNARLIPDSIPRYAIIEAPSILGLFPKGVEALPDALLAVGLGERLEARRAGRLEPPPYDNRRDPETMLLNPKGIADYSVALADLIGRAIDMGDFPVVLGGDCSIVLGCLLSLKRRGRHGLLFVDGRADFYQPEAEPNGEVASMDLAFATGREPAILANLEAPAGAGRGRCCARGPRRQGCRGARWCRTRTLLRSGAATPRMPRRTAANVSRTLRSGLLITPRFESGAQATQSIAPLKSCHDPSLKGGAR
jgi:arginase family enzyme